jgi:hypothetical protein
MIAIHPKDYRAWRNLATLYWELGDRAFHALYDSWDIAAARVFITGQGEFR